MIEFDYWQLLLFPLFFVLGWGAARVDIRHWVKESRELPTSYFRGLHFLLNEEPDKAIEAFIEVVKVNPETLELHFALGNLFRRRGEFERAIRMHQSLLEREGQSDPVRQHALFELGQDFLKAGLLDRAEGIFLKMETTSFHDAAREQLLEIYQLEKNWLKAINMAEQISSLSSLKSIAHYLCEMAAESLLRGQLEEAQAFLESALQRHRSSVRASILLGDLFFKQEKISEAIDIWQKIESQNPDFLSLIGPRFRESYTQLGKADEGRAILQSYLERYPSIDLLDCVFRWVLEEEGPDMAHRLIRTELQKNPSLIGLDRLLEVQLARVDHVDRSNRADLEMIRSILSSYVRKLGRYQCGDCGFKARQFYWRCPACGEWETYPPRRTEEFDS